MARRMRFQTWAKKDPEDTRKIFYVLTDKDGNMEAFTSEDTVSWSTLERIRNAWVRSIKLGDNTWYADLYED